MISRTYLFPSSEFYFLFKFQEFSQLFYRMSIDESLSISVNGDICASSSLHSHTGLRTVLQNFIFFVVCTGFHLRNIFCVTPNVVLDVGDSLAGGVPNTEGTALSLCR